MRFGLEPDAVVCVALRLAPSHHPPSPEPPAPLRHYCGLSFRALAIVVEHHPVIGPLQSMGSEGIREKGSVVTATPNGMEDR